MEGPFGRSKTISGTNQKIYRMIGKISMGRSFKGCILYCMEDKKLDQRQRLKQEHMEQYIVKDRAELVHYNLCYGDKNELIKQFNEVRQLNQKLSKPVLHVSLSLAPEDVLQQGKMAEMAEECAQKMGFSNNQYIAIYHKDTNHQHLHIVANRVGFDGKTVSDSHNYKKVAEYCRRMEQKLQLKEVLSPRLYLSQKERLIERHDIRMEELKQRIKLSINQSRSYLEFEHRIKQYGYEVIRGRGIAFRDAQKVYTKGSELGYSLATIEKQLQMQLVLKQSLTLEQKQFLELQRRLDKETEQINEKQQQRQGQKLEFKKEEDNSSEARRHRLRQEQILDIITRPVENEEDLPYQLKKSQRQRISH
jgi:hypothetical protein